MAKSLVIATGPVLFGLVHGGEPVREKGILNTILHQRMGGISGLGHKPGDAAKRQLCYSYALILKRE